MSDTITINLPLPPRNGKTQTLLPHCRALIDAGADPKAIVHVMRGATLCFVPAPLEAFAGLTVEESAGVSARFRKYQPMPDTLRAGADEK